ncbi:hypothetical protein ACN47E_004684 [Coniothyrium glycines]
MQYLTVVLLALAVLAAARVASLPEHASNQKHNITVTNSIGFAFDLDNPAVATSNAGTPFDKAVESGGTLYIAMRSKDSVAQWFFKGYPNFAGTVQSPFDGDLRTELRTWGYKDDDELSKKIEKDCDFDKYHHMKEAFDELGLDTKAKTDGGPNACFRIDHKDGPAIKRNSDQSLPGESQQYYDVCGKEYRATGATFEFAANPQGAVVLSNVISAMWSAKSVFMWNRPATTDELPELRSTADIAWGVWNRVASGNLQNVKYLMVTNILNASSRELVRDALSTLQPPQSEIKVWPGHEFSMESKGGKALLGSPVGRWAGYFLLQHKAQLGGNRFISKVRVFKTNGFFPYLVFYVDPTPVSDTNSAPARQQQSRLPSLMTKRSASGQWTSQIARRIVGKSVDGNEMVREYVFSRT